MTSPLPLPPAEDNSTPSDPYAWLQSHTAETLSHLEKETRFANEMLQNLAPLQDQIREEILGHADEAIQPSPVLRHPYLYYSRLEAADLYEIYCRKHVDAIASEEVLLDVNKIAAGRGYIRIGTVTTSVDHRFLAYAVDLSGREIYTIYIRDLENGSIIDIVNRASSMIVWAHDGSALFYVGLSENGRANQVLLRRIGSGFAECLYLESDAQFSVSLYEGRSSEYIFAVSQSETASEVHYCHKRSAPHKLGVVCARSPFVRYGVVHQGQYFYMRTNSGGKGFRVVRALVNSIPNSEWEEVLPCRSDTSITDLQAFEGHLVIVERAEGIPIIRICEASDVEHFHHLRFPEHGYSIRLGGHQEYHSAVLRVEYTSLKTPHTIYEYDMKERNLRSVRQRTIRGYDPSCYEVRRLCAPASDGTQIPIYIVYRMGISRDGGSPAVLCAYGAYGTCLDPGFSIARLSLLDRGVMFAIAQVRGGGEFGPAWHIAGKLLNKRSTFTDFLACTDHLIAQGFTKPDRLAITGESAGGLVIGAALNMRPNLFKAALLKAPFVDVLGSMFDIRHPLTCREYDEWGDPRSKLYYEYIRSYSPYENVRATQYPAIFALTSIHDSHVPYWHAAKWVARIRSHNKGESIVLLKVDMQAGHFGPSNRHHRVDESALESAFLLNAITGR